MCGKFQAPLRLLLIWGIIYILGYLHDTNFNFSINSSFNPNLREINFYEKNCQFIVWGPKLQAVWRNRGSANRPKMDQFEIFLIIHCTKSKLKGGLFYEKNCQLMYLRPILWAVLDILGVLFRPVCQTGRPVFGRLLYLVI